MTSLPRFSVDNPVLVNLMTWTLLVGGVYSALTLVREMFPEATPNAVRIRTIYPGATPAEVEKGISVKIEEAIKDIEEIEELNTTIGEGSSVITAVLRSGVDDVDQVVTDIKAAIDTIPTRDFPQDAEETQVRKMEPNIPVINVSYFGDLDEKTLKDAGRRLRDDLLAIPGITEVVLQGVRADEISVEVLPAHINGYGLSLPQIADAIANANLDLPGGQIKTADANVSVRTLGEKDEAESIGRIIVRSDPSGKVIRLNQVAEVIDGFEDADLKGRFNTKPTALVTVLKTPRQDAVDISRKVKALVAGKMGETLERDWWATLKYRLGLRDGVEQAYAAGLGGGLPYGSPLNGRGTLKTSTNLARFIEGRLDLLKRNGMWGLIFVFCSLLLFLNWRVAFWVMFGLLLAILGTLMVMRLFSLSLNLISMFGLIVVLGLLVDDAIIVGEHIFTRMEEGMEPRLAAITGAEAVTWPVVCTILTTIVAFGPLLFIQGQIGDFMGVLPVIVICALSVSLFESLSILPCHLAASPRIRRGRDGGTEGRRDGVLVRESLLAPAQSRSRLGALAAGFHSLQNYMVKTLLIGGYERLLRKTVSNRYVTMAALVAVLIVALGMIAGGRVPIVYVQKVDSETLMASLKMPVGTPIDGTDRALKVVEQAAYDLGPELDSLFTVMGVQYSMEGRMTGRGSHVGQLLIELKSLEQRQRSSEDIIRELRAKTADIPGVNALRFSAMHGGPGGAALQIEISGPRLADLVAAADDVESRLSGYAGVFDIDNDFDAGRREVQIELLDSARALGLTTQSLATQVRGAFYGLEARKIQRDREDVKIMVRYPERSRARLSDIESMWIAAGDGTLVPFCEAARIKEGRAYATIRRKDQQRTVTVTADVDQATGNARRISAELAAAFPEIQRKYPGVKLEFGGQSREFAKSFGSLRRDFLVAALLIYVVLAGLFKSYVQPVIVMTAIPFGIIGAVAGHYLMGYPITIMSLIGFVALTWIVVNDSLILVNWINHRRAEGETVYEAVIQGGRARMRAILLTSITTILGLAPLLLETSFQARFLIPMGVSIAAGLAFATVVTLIAVPALYMMLIDLQHIVENIGGFFGFGPRASQARPTLPVRG